MNFPAAPRFTATASAPTRRAASACPAAASDDDVRAFQADARSVIIALTHDPKLDDMALMEALRSDAFYVGALGSHASQAKRRARLLELDLTPQQVGRLHGPVGYPLGGKTPPEIALAILAEVTALRNGIRLVPAADLARIAERPSGRRRACSEITAEISG